MARKSRKNESFSSRRLRRALAVVAAAAACLAILPACAAASGESVSVYGSLATIRPDRALPAGASTSASLIAAKNEYQSFQVVVTAGSDLASGVRVDPGAALVGPGGATIPANNITVYREAYYNVSTPSDNEGGVGQWPDVLIPERDVYYHEDRNAFPVNLQPGTQVVAWVDVLVPQDATAGEYSGTFEVKDQGGVVSTVPVSVDVQDFQIPSTSTLTSSFPLSSYKPCTAETGDYGCNGNADQSWQLERLYAEAGLNNRVTVSNPFPGVYGDSGAPDAPISASAKARFQQYILPLIDGTDTGTQLPGAKLTSLLAFGTCARSGSTCLSDWKQLAEQYGFSDRFYILLCDEPYANASLWNSECKPNASRVDQTWPGVHRLVTTNIGDVNSHSATGAVDTVAPVINDVAGRSGPLTGNQRPTYNSFLDPSSNTPGTPANQMWMYTSCLSFGCTGDASTSQWDGWAGYAIDEPASQAEAMGWLAFAYDASGEFYYDSGNKLTTAWSDQYYAGGNGDGTLFYPGTPNGVGSSLPIGGTHEIPIESLRLKRIRDGREAYEYLHLVDQRGDHAAAMSIVQGLFGSLDSATHSTTVSQGRVDTARAQLAGLITGTTPVVSDPPDSFTTPAAPGDQGSANTGTAAAFVSVARGDGQGTASTRASSGRSARIIRVKVPHTVKGLSRTGVRALVRCTARCRVELTPTVSRRAVHRLGLHTSKIGRGSAEIAAYRTRWVRAPIGGGVRHRLARSRNVGTFQVKTLIHSHVVGN